MGPEMRLSHKTSAKIIAFTQEPAYARAELARAVTRRASTGRFLSGPHSNEKIRWLFLTPVVFQNDVSENVV